MKRKETLTVLRQQSFMIKGNIILQKDKNKIKQLRAVNKIKRPVQISQSNFLLKKKYITMNLLFILILKNDENCMTRSQRFKK
jgi:hypothetical protein